MPVRIVICGPPNSGKSTLAESLSRALLLLGVDAAAVDLDLASPTLEYIKGQKDWKDRSKKEWTKELGKEAAARFVEASRRHEVVIGDAPGKITDVTRIICGEAHYAIILCRYDLKAEINNWQIFLRELNVPVICTAISKITGEGKVDKKKNLIEATLIKLDRKPRTDEAITLLASLIKNQLAFRPEFH